MRRVDPAGRLVRNPGVHAHDLQPPASPPEVPSPVAASPLGLVDMVVLSGDTLLYEAIRHAAGARTAVWRADTAAESVDLLLSGRCGVLLIDMAAMSAEPGSFVRQILAQFPDVVVVAAGRREDEPVLASLISEGLVYRLMHKPISPRRAQMFLEAAVRCHVDRRQGGTPEPALPFAGRRRSRLDPRKWGFVGGGLVAFLALLAAMLVDRPADRGEARQAGPVARPTIVVPAPGPLADPVLARARAAFDAGRDESPPGRNALDLYSAVLLARPDDLEARSGLAATADRLVAKAESAAGIGNRREARRLASRVLEASPGHAGARALLTRLEPPQEPAPRAAMPAPSKTPPSTEPTPKPSPTAGKRPPEGATRSTATKAAPVPTTARVQPDPLAPRVVRKPAATPADAGSTRHRGVRSYGAPISSGHRTAGYATSQPEGTVAAAIAPLPVTRDANRPTAASDLEAVSLPEPVYPLGAWRARIEGWVQVEYTVTAQGATRDVEVVAAEPRGVFEAAATEAVARWRFRPRVVNGQPVAQRSAVTLRFNVED
jgi:protein TonB